jgi:hypothetical protein
VSLQVIIYVLTALAAVVVVLTRVRLRKEAVAGPAQVPRGVLAVHTIGGLLALAAWSAYLVAPDDSDVAGPVVGIVALALWWIVALCGLLILLRWLPIRGRHAQVVREDSWSDGPGLSVLAHVGLFVGVCIFTVSYMLGLV